MPSIEIPSVNPEKWNIKPGELSSSHVQRLGILLYVVAFTQEWSPEYQEHLEKSGMDSITKGRVYAKRFAKQFGLDSALTQRWMHQSALELAQPQLDLANERLTSGSEDYWVKDAFDIMSRIREKGIDAIVADHKFSVKKALDLKLYPDFPFPD